MSFFEPPPPPPEPPEAHVQPVWVGPPDNMFGVPFPLSVVLARTGDVALHVHSGLSYPAGIEFSLQLLQREHPRDHLHGPIHDWHRGRHEGALEPHVLRFGIELADGRKATVFDAFPSGLEGEPGGPVLVQRGGGGGDRRYDMRFWLWPLPPPGALAFVAEWPAQGVALTRESVDTKPILEAAARVEELWSDGSPSGGSGGFTTQVMTARRTPAEPGT